ncbi:MAG: hypothetical protein WAZ48_13690 [Lysobacteraceae bacterium]
MSGLKMAKNKTELQRAAGKLISAIQKEWGGDLGETHADFSEDVMNAAHDLLQSGTVEDMKKTLGSLNVRQFLGDVWVQRHPNVKPAIESLEVLLNK